ncbi:MAG: Gfo/Idh/MocA family oxidoreductase [Bacteroidetes bacterium]|nr:Gfo/Idh/MocA family oxidoreductase [Bacteroidota bacterium]
MKIKFGIVGCGHIGKRHAEMVSRHPEAELVALCDILPKEKLSLEKFSAPFYSSIDEMLADAERSRSIEVVNICTPNGLHAALSVKALEAKKHVVCEKPMALSKADCENMIHKSMQVQKNIFVVKQNRYSPPSAWIKELIDKKNLGDIYLVQLNCYWNRDERYYKKGSWKGTKEFDGGVLFTQFSHFIDIMYWLFGDIKDIQAKFKNFNHKSTTEFDDDSGLVSFNFLNGGMGCIQYSTSVWDKNMESSIAVIGSKGTVKIGGQYMDKVEYCHIENYSMPNLAETNPANDYGGYKGSANNHPLMIQNVIDTLKGRNTITANALEGMKVVEIIEKIYSLKPAYEHLQKTF